MHKIVLLFCSGIISSTALFSQDTTLEQIIFPSEKVQLLSSQFSFAEGSADDAIGNIYFTDQPDNQIYGGVFAVEAKPGHHPRPEPVNLFLPE